MRMRISVYTIKEDIMKKLLSLLLAMALILGITGALAEKDFLDFEEPYRLTP